MKNDVDKETYVSESAKNQRDTIQGQDGGNSNNQELEKTIKKKLKASEIMSKTSKERKEFEVPPKALDKSGIDLTEGPPPPMKSKKTGPPINVSEIMGKTGN